MTDDPVIEAAIEDLELQNDRYYSTVYLTIGMKVFLEQNPQFEMKVTSCGTKMVPTVDNEGNPLNEVSEEDKARNDILLQDTKNEKGVIIEVKTSYPISDVKFQYAITEDIDQLKKFDRDVKGWKSPGEDVEEYCIILMPYHAETARKAVEHVGGLLDAPDNEKKLKFRHPFSIWYWNRLPLFKKRVREIIQIFPSGIGKGVGWKLGEFVDNHFVEIDHESLYEQYDVEKHRFSREPPDNMIPIIEVIYFSLFGELRKNEVGSAICTLDEMMRLAAKYFPPWIPDDNNESQIRRSWMRRTLEMLENIGMARKLPDDEGYELSPLSSKQKDFTADVYKRIAKFLLKKKKIVAPVGEREEATIIDQFPHSQNN